MKLNDYKLVFITFGFIGVLLIASPAIGTVLNLQSEEQFSELFILGPNMTATDIPFNIVPGQNYSIYVGVGNHLEASTFYQCYVKLSNQTDSLPNEENQTPSALPSVYKFNILLQKGANWTAPLYFSVEKASAYDQQLHIERLAINNITFTVDKMAQLDPDNNGYFFKLLIELYALQPKSQSFQYQNRFVYLCMNVTQTI